MLRLISLVTYLLVELPIFSCLTGLKYFTYNIDMMSLIYTANLFLAILIILLAGFIAIPALRRLIRNVYLTRKGSIATGHYLSSNRAVFFLDTGKRIEFSTWRKRPAASGEIEVLYNPEQPGQAEVRNSGILWIKPVDTIAQAIGSLTTACAMVLKVNYVLAICLGVACIIALWLLLRIVIILLLILSMKYKPFHSIGIHIFAGFKSTKAKALNSKKASN